MSENEQHAARLERLIGMTEVLGALDSDEIRAALAAGAAALREIDTLRAQLAECYRLTGADPDGNEDAMLAPHAVDEVRRLRMDGEKSSELLAKALAQLAEARAAVITEVKARVSGLSNWIRIPGNIHDYDAIDECARAVANLADGLDALAPAPHGASREDALSAALFALVRECYDDGHSKTGGLSDSCGRRGQVIRCGICEALIDARRLLGLPVDALAPAPPDSGDEMTITNRLAAVEAANVTLDTENAQLRQALRVIRKGLSDDADGEFWPARRWLDTRNIYHGDLSGNRVLELVAKHALHGEQAEFTPAPVTREDAVETPGATEALGKLSSEVYGLLCYAGDDIRQAVGHTNMSVLQARINEARRLLGLPVEGQP